MSVTKINFSLLNRETKLMNFKYFLYCKSLCTTPLFSYDQKQYYRPDVIKNWFIAATVKYYVRRVTIN